VNGILQRLARVRRDALLTRAFRKLLLDDAGKPKPEATEVIGHLRAFCFADVSTLRYDREGRLDAAATAAAVGRQEVWLQFYFYLNLDDRDLVAIDRDYQEMVDRQISNGRTAFDH
jgi:hypothetical protein